MKGPPTAPVTQVSPVWVSSEKLVHNSGASMAPVTCFLVHSPERKGIQQLTRIKDKHSSVAMTSQKAGCLREGGSQTVLDNGDDSTCSSTSSRSLSSIHVASHQNLTSTLCKPLGVKLAKLDVTAMNLRPSKSSRKCLVYELRSKGVFVEQSKSNDQLTASNSFLSLGKQPRGLPAAKDVNGPAISEDLVSCSRVTSEQQISFPEHEGAAALLGTACEKQTLVEENVAGSLMNSPVSCEEKMCLQLLSDKVLSNVTDGCSNTNSQRQSEKHHTAHCHEKG